MGKWVIDKTIEFCYGHRVWTQVLNGEYSDDLQCACRHLHGHEGKVMIHLTGDGLDPTGMVTDFRHLEWLKKWVNANVDHQFILDISDPLYTQLVGKDELYEILVPGTNHIAGRKINLDNTEPGTPEYEYKEGFFIVDFVPTSENLSKWMSELVQVKMEPLNVKVDSIEWWETPKSRSIYYV
ncbi:MAG: 6-carboxytetrahydropterin synthase [Candidatus Thioglobus sp.]|jgi:6-pyruvoyltetrahydropterin/6-carboxytetrahydropterin synthase